MPPPPPERKEKTTYYVLANFQCNTEVLPEIDEGKKNHICITYILTLHVIPVLDKVCNVTFPASHL